MNHGANFVTREIFFEQNPEATETTWASLQSRIVKYQNKDSVDTTFFNKQGVYSKLSQKELDKYIADNKDSGKSTTELFDNFCTIKFKAHEEP